MSELYYKIILFDLEKSDRYKNNNKITSNLNHINHIKICQKYKCSLGIIKGSKDLVIHQNNAVIQMIKIKKKIWKKMIWVFLKK